MTRRDALKKATLLLGGALSAPTLMAMKRWETPSPDRLLGMNFSLTAAQKQIVAEVAEMILPRTATAGAKDAGVPAFIEMMLVDCYNEPEHSSFLAGVQALEKDKFMDMDAATKTERLKKLEAETKEAMKARQVKQTKAGDNVDKEEMKQSSKGLPFWRLMKELTLLGYFTSEVGMKASFDYQPIPGKLENIKLKPNQKAFAY